LLRFGTAAKQRLQSRGALGFRRDIAIPIKIPIFIALQLIQKMKKHFYLTLLLFFTSLFASAQAIDSLQRKIEKIITSKNAIVGVSIISSNGKDQVSVNEEANFPMQSVFKFHIALAVLSQIDEGKFSLNQKIKIEKKDLIPNTYSSIRDKYPNGTNLTIAEVLKYTVSQSDNIGCDVLLRLIGGPHIVEEYFTKNGFNDISIKLNEEDQQKDWNLQYQNWTTPKAANEVLMKYYDAGQKFLSQKSYQFIWKTMRETSTGKNRIKGQLPKKTIVAHKTGSSGTNNDGLTAAVNDIGIVFLPNGEYFFISVFVSESKENADTNEKIIADIAKAAWDYFADKEK
jgi:beta-lactamase class A